MRSTIGRRLRSAFQSSLPPRGQALDEASIEMMASVSLGVPPCSGSATDASLLPLSCTGVSP